MIIPQSKPCSKCKVEKSLNSFYREKTGKYGRRSECIECRKAYHKRYEQTDNAKKRVRKYGQTEKARRTWRRNNKTTAGIIRYNRYCSKHPEKRKAKDAVSYAIKMGNLPKVATLTCEHCQKQAQHYHHPDYSRPMKVVPLCVPCHRAVHK